jgi:hypothetical protein
MREVYIMLEVHCNYNTPLRWQNFSFDRKIETEAVRWSRLLGQIKGKVKLVPVVGHAP